MKKLVNFILKHDTLVLVLGSIILELIIYAFSSCINNSAKLIIPLLLVYGIFIYLMIVNNKTVYKKLFYLIYLLGLVLRTIYILDTDIFTRQHDVLNLFENGHLDYIYTLYKTHRLPITREWQFYHPPLWHIIGALWLKVCELFKVNLYDSFEGLQIFPTLFSSFVIIIVDKICLKLKLKDKYRYLIDLMFSVHPTLIILSGSINNDCLVTFLEMWIVLLLINWYQDNSFKNTIYLAIVTGLCVMTKLNGAMMAIPIMYVFIVKFIKSLKEKKVWLYIKKILVFGIISLPIGLWFQIRSLIKFGNIDCPLPGDWLYTGSHTVFDRFFKIDFKMLYNYADMSKEYNLPSFIIKSSLFGEYFYENIDVIKNILITVNMILIVISIIFMIRYLFIKKKNNIMNILMVTWTVMIVSMYFFCYRYPYACSMDFRYIVICLLPSIIFIGYMLNTFKNKYFKWITGGTCLIFILMSTMLVFLVY